VVVFGPERSRAAWSFAKALLEHTADRVSVRLGIASGIVVVVGGNRPVGKGVLRADRLSGLAEVGQPCVSQRFWRSLDDHERGDWSSTPVLEDAEALKVQKQSAAANDPRRTEDVVPGPGPKPPTGAARGAAPDRDRAALVQTVSGLSPGDFAQLVTLIPRASSHVSRQGTVREQAAELIGWAESSTGPGLDVIREALNFR
jgi:hypothetical protein